jgi:hypothetical protein
MQSDDLYLIRRWFREREQLLHLENLGNTDPATPNNAVQLSASHRFHDGAAADGGLDSFRKMFRSNRALFIGWPSHDCQLPLRFYLRRCGAKDHFRWTAWPSFQVGSSILPLRVNVQAQPRRPAPPRKIVSSDLQ